MKVYEIRITEDQRKTLELGVCLLLQIGEVAFQLMHDGGIEPPDGLVVETGKLARMMEQLPPAVDGVHDLTGGIGL